MTRVRSALFIDFDNVFGKLLAEDRAAALAFAEEPGTWVANLARSYPTLGDRSWLVRRCYLNPAGSVADPEAVPGDDGRLPRIFFSRFRPYFTKAGFEMVDCPALTRGGKNAADIRMVLDATDAVNAPTRYDEFVVVASDSDFTPLLLRLRAADRRTVIVSPSFVAEAYRGVADLHLGSEEIRLLLEVNPLDGQIPAQPATTEAQAESTTSGQDAADTAESLRVFGDALVAALAASAGPLNFANLVPDLRAQMQGRDGGNWFGYGSITRTLAAVNLPHVSWSPHHVWDVLRHTPPAEAANATSADLLPAIRRLCLLLDLPRVEAEVWPSVYKAIADYLAESRFELDALTRAAKASLHERGVEVGRAALFTVCRGALHGGCDLRRQPPPSVEEIGTAFLRSVLDRAQSAQIELTDDDVAEVSQWCGARLLEPT